MVGARGFIAFIVVVSLAACTESGRKTNDPATEETGNSAAAESAAADKDSDPSIGIVMSGPLDMIGGTLPPDHSGKPLFVTHCATCHVGPNDPHTPAIFNLASLSPRLVLSALENGKMQAQGAALDAAEKSQVVEWLTGSLPGALDIPEAALCTASDPDTVPSMQVHSNGWGGDLSATGYRNAQQAGMTAKDLDSLKLQWVFAIPGASEMRSKPLVIGDRVLFGSQFGTLYNLDRKTGCIHWQYETGSAIRGAVVTDAQDKADKSEPALIFVVNMKAIVFAIDALTGELVWQSGVGSHAMAHNTGSAIYHDGQIIVPLSSSEIIASSVENYECCKTAGEVVAVDAKDGNVQWRHRTISEPAKPTGTNTVGVTTWGPSGAPVWSSPTIDAKRNLVYVGTGENYTAPATESSDSILALDLKSGELRWSYQATSGDIWNLDCGDPENPANCPDAGPDVDFGMAPILVTRSDGSDVLIAGQKSGHVHALDPDQDGKVLWVNRVSRGSALGGIHWGMASDGARAYAPIADLPWAVTKEILPRQQSQPGVVALDTLTGEILWRDQAPGIACRGDDPTCLRANSGAPTAIEGAVFSGSIDGHIRAYAADTGKVLWEFATDREFDAVNGVPAHGGSVDGPGPVIADGQVFVLSGYTTNIFNPGNVIIAFGIQ